jgi:hypothetical protein
MNGGTISGCNASSYGGGVYVYNVGTFMMNGGAITGCNATSGGGVMVYSTALGFTMTDGTISGCNASRYGGGVYLEGFPGFKMTGGVITGNNADEDGGGVCCYGHSITVGGSAVISGNVKGGAKGENGVYACGMANNAKLGTDSSGNEFMPIIVGSALTSGARIGVTMPPSFATSAFTRGLANGGENALKCFTGDAAGSFVVLDGNEARLVASSLADGSVTAPAGATLVCATYKDGRMTGVQTVTLAENCIGKAASELLTVPTNGQYKLFLLDGKTYAPLCAAWDSARE